MNLGAFCLSLAVEDIHASKAFYEKLGFEQTGGDIDQNWVVLRNDQRVVGLFQGMFDKNTLTFNPGWDQAANPVDSFTDIRELQRTLKSRGVAFDREADETTTGPEYFVLIDPDGNPILVDQHVESPAS